MITSLRTRTHSVTFCTTCGHSTYNYVWRRCPQYRLQVQSTYTLINTRKQSITTSMCNIDLVIYCSSCQVRQQYIQRHRYYRQLPPVVRLLPAVCCCCCSCGSCGWYRVCARHWLRFHPSASPTPSTAPAPFQHKRLLLLNNSPRKYRRQRRSVAGCRRLTTWRCQYQHEKRCCRRGVRRWRHFK